MTLTERQLNNFMAKIDYHFAGCWLWTGAQSSEGYGYVKLAGRTLSAHRVSYELFIGPIGEGLEPDHLCRVRNCVNPDDIEPVTRSVNLTRGDHANRRKTHCPRGHEYTEDNTRYQVRRGITMRKCRACHAARSHA